MTTRCRRSARSIHDQYQPIIGTRILAPAVDVLRTILGSPHEQRGPLARRLKRCNEAVVAPERGEYARVRGIFVIRLLTGSAENAA